MRRFWLAFTAVIVLSFAVLGWTGVRIYQQAPPVPERVVTTDGRQVIGTDDIFDGGRRERLRLFVVVLRL